MSSERSREVPGDGGPELEARDSAAYRQEAGGNATEKDEEEKATDEMPSTSARRTKYKDPFERGRRK